MELSGTAALDEPRRHSPLRALFWKEWRQQRWIFFLIAGLMCALLISGLIVARWGRFAHAEANDVAGALFGLAAFLVGVGVVILSANAFAGEHEDNTEQFLETIPCSRGKLFLAKLGFVLFLLLIELIPLALAALCFVANLPSPRYIKFIADCGPVDVLLAAGAVLAVAIVPALTASFGGSVIATILGCIPAAAVCGGWMIGSLWLLKRFVPIGLDAAAWSLCAVLTATIVVVAWRLWTNQERTPRRAGATVAVAALLLLAAVVLPISGSYCYLTYFAPVSYFLKSQNRVAGAEIVAVSPNGKRVVLEGWYSGWGGTGTCALLDADSGRSEWVTRFRYSDAYNWQWLWSPSGNWFFLESWDRRLNPFGRDEAERVSFAVDAGSGEKHSFSELCPNLARMPSIWYPNPFMAIGWYSEHVFAIRDRNDILFADLEDHKVQRCTMPRGLQGPRYGGFYGSRTMTQRGIFIGANEEQPPKQMRVVRFAPELSEAQTLKISGLPDTARLWLASRDGRRLIISAYVHDSGIPEAYIARLDDGTKLELLASPKRASEGFIADSWRICSFLHDSHQVFLYNEKEIGVFDVDSHVLRRILLHNETKSWVIDSVKLSPHDLCALVLYYSVFDERGNLVHPFSVVNVEGGTCLDFTHVETDTGLLTSQYVGWLGDEHLWVGRTYPSGIMIMNRDGTGARPLLK
jgi:hypothetical protein